MVEFRPQTLGVYTDANPPPINSEYWDWKAFQFLVVRWELEVEKALGLDADINSFSTIRGHSTSWLEKGAGTSKPLGDGTYLETHLPHIERALYALTILLEVRAGGHAHLIHSGRMLIRAAISLRRYGG